jgi:hypothetical protein
MRAALVGETPRQGLLVREPKSPLTAIGCIASLCEVQQDEDVGHQALRAYIQRNPAG